MDIAAFIAELKRRKVVRVTGIYVVVAFGVLQGAQLLIDALHLPPWVLTLLVVTALVALPVVMMLAWVFDVQRTSSARAPGAHALAFLGVGILVALVGFAAYATYRPAASVDSQSVAVLPFVNMSGDKQQEYFGDGITEEILNVLAQFPSLRVPARTSSFSFKEKNLPVGEIARQLSVTHVLEGSVRRYGSQVRITAQLIDATSDRHLWSETYDRPVADLFAVQNEIAHAIAEQLQLRVVKSVSSTTTPNAHEAYLKGLYYLNRRHTDELPQALDYFKQTVAEDPKFAPGYAGIALTYALLPQFMRTYDHLLAIREGKAAAQQALRLDPRNAPAHAALGEIALELEWHWDDALAHLNEAIALDRNLSMAYMWRGSVHSVRGQFPEALEDADRGVELDPLSGIALLHKARILLQLGRIEEGLTLHRQIIANDPGWLVGMQEYQADLIATQHYDEALKTAESAGDTAFYMSLKSHTMSPLISGAVKPDVPLPQWFKAQLYLQVNQPDSAMALLNRVEWESQLAYVAHSSFFAPLRGRPEFQQLVRRLGL